MAGKSVTGKQLKKTIRPEKKLSTAKHIDAYNKAYKAEMKKNPNPSSSQASKMVNSAHKKATSAVGYSQSQAQSYERAQYLKSKGAMGKASKALKASGLHKKK